MILPQPDDHFEWIDTAGRPGLVCRPLAPFARHLFTSRVWPLGSNRADLQKWGEVARAVGADPSRLFRAHQVHGAGILIHRDGPPVESADGDILITGDSRVAAAVQSADCVPLLIADTRTGVVAAAHAGWRGLAQRVPLVTVEAMETAFGSRASKLVAAIGPAIGGCCYEVGGDVRDRFAAGGFSDWELARWFFREPRSSSRNPSMAGVPRQAREGHWFLDLSTVARDQLRVAGVREDRIFAAELCTASHADVFCSYRRDGERVGRLAAVIRAERAAG
jgi:purine-nucleoside/S-methyl-5'-thioadenosine phosphorylase / adenosine deaminase